MTACRLSPSSSLIFSVPVTLRWCTKRSGSASINAGTEGSLLRPGSYLRATRCTRSVIDRVHKLVEASPRKMGSGLHRILCSMTTCDHYQRHPCQSTAACPATHGLLRTCVWPQSEFSGARLMLFSTNLTYACLQQMWWMLLPHNVIRACDSLRQMTLACRCDRLAFKP